MRSCGEVSLWWLSLDGFGVGNRRCGRHRDIVGEVGRRLVEVDGRLVIVENGDGGLTSALDELGAFGLARIEDALLLARDLLVDVVALALVCSSAGRRVAVGLGRRGRWRSVEHAA